MNVIAYLKGYFLCPFQLLVDVNEQLPNPCNTLNSLVFSPICELNTTNDWINLEALGHPVALRGQQLSALLAEALNDSSSLDIHLYGIEGQLTLDSVFALLFLSDHLETLQLYCHSAKQHHPLLAEQLAILCDRQNIAVHLVGPEPDADHEATIQHLHTQRLAVFLKKYQFNLQPSEITNDNMGVFIGYAWTCLKAGAYEIGCHLLEHLLRQGHLSAMVYEHLFMHLQLIRFLSHQYTIVTKEPFPDVFHYLQPSDSINIYFIKAYSATLSRNLSVAEAYFKKCRVHPKMPMTDEASLYRLNLHALFLVLKDEIDAALSLEMKIQDHIKEQHITTVGLKYVNFINIARVCKKTKRYDDALTYYEKAYQELKGGGVTSSDHIYYNMNLGSLCEAAGQKKEAFYYWVKAALYWLTSANPYALAWRPRLILCQEKIDDILKPISCEAVNQFLFNKIKYLLPETRIHLKPVAGVSWSATHADIKKEACYLASGIVVYRAKEGKKAVPESELHQLVSGIVCSMMDIRDKAVLLIDHEQELSYPQSLAGCAALAIQSNCKVFYYEGQRAQFETEHVGHVSVSLTKAIRSIQTVEGGLELSYSRSFLNKKVIEHDEMQLIQYIADKKKVTYGALVAEEASLNTLISKRVIAVSV